MIKLYFGHISQYLLPEDDASIRELLGDYRADAVLRNKTEPGRRLSFLAGMLLKKALADEGTDIVSARFGLTERGKPYILRDDCKNGPHFSISHSGELALVAISDVPVGCDIQKIEDKTPENCLRLAGRFFTENEYAALEGMLDEPVELLRKFHLIFSGKESFVKCTGEGLAGIFSSFELPPYDSEYDGYAIRYFSPGDVRDRLPKITFLPEYAASVCNNPG